MSSDRAPSNPHNQRQNYLINPGFQWKQAGAISLIVFFITTTLSAVLYGILQQQSRALAANPTGYRPETTLVMVCFGLGYAALTAGGIGFWSILMTHRICGPLFVIKRYLCQIAEGRLPYLRPLRRRDEFKDLYEALDEAIRSLRVARERELSQIRAAIGEVRAGLNAEDGIARDALQSVAERLDWLKNKAEESLAPETAKPTAGAQRAESPAREAIAV